MKVTTKEFVEILEDITRCVKEHDSFEGTLNYNLSEEFGYFEIEGAYRFGNSSGQGSMRLLKGKAYGIHLKTEERKSK